MATEWRHVSESERELIDLLLAAHFTGREAIEEQLRTARARVVDAEGSLGFDVACTKKAIVKHTIPIEAEAQDADGITLHMLLHVVNGIVTELEFYKDDNSPIARLPPPPEWKLVELHG